MAKDDLHKKKSKIIINADDFGITPGVNKAIIELADCGNITSTSVMTNMPYYTDANKLKNKIGIGVHLNLTVGKPVSSVKDVPTLIDSKGYFYDFSTLRKKIQADKISIEEVYAEFDTQINQLQNNNIKPDHVNTHQSLLKYPFFFSIIKKVAAKNGIEGIRTYKPIKFRFKRYLNPKKIVISLYLAYQKSKLMSEGFQVVDRIDSLSDTSLTHTTAIKRLNEIFQSHSNGILELIAHPGYLDQENRFLGSYIKEREIEQKALLSKEFKTIIETNGLKLVSFKNINH